MILGAYGEEQEHGEDNEDEVQGYGITVSLPLSGNSNLIVVFLGRNGFVIVIIYNKQT